MEFFAEKRILELIEKDDKEGLEEYVKTNGTYLKVRKAGPIKFHDETLNSFSLLHFSAIYNSIKCFDYLMNDHGIPIDIECDGNYLPIHFSLYFGCYEISSHILSIYKNKTHIIERKEQDKQETNELDILFTKDYSNPNPSSNLLLNAFNQGSDIKKRIFYQICDLLYNNGYDPNKIQSMDIKERILYYIVLHVRFHSNFFNYLKPFPFRHVGNLIVISDPVILEHFFKLGWDPNLIDTNGDTLLTIALLRKQEELVEVLLKYMNPIDPPNANPVVCEICRSCKPNIARRILSHNIDVYRLDKFGRFGPFYLPSRNEKNNIEIISLLIEYGFDINFKDEEGNSLLGSILYRNIRNQYKCCEWLILLGADVYCPINHKINQSIKEYLIGKRSFEIEVVKY